MIEAGTVLQNRYRVERQIGEGGMGAVYIATDQRFGSTVAIKETFFTDQSLRKAFEREARLLNNLRHPALPRVSDHFVEENGQFIVMEYITGEDLSLMMEKKGTAFPLKDVLDWADQLLDALDFLHTQETPVIHRDIKPQNLKLTPRGQVILLDFGLAKGNPTDAKHQTAAKSVFGYSRHYASLEQIQGTGTDPRSDLYSLGATLYHLLTGLDPIDALTRAMKVLNGDPDPLPPADKAHPQVTPQVAEVISRAMALNGNHRPTSAVAMRVMLSEAASEKSSGQPQSVTAVERPVTGLLNQETEIIEKSANSGTQGKPDAATRAAALALAQDRMSATDSGEVETVVSTSVEGRPAGGIEIPVSGGGNVSSISPVRLEPPPARKGMVLGAAALGALIVVGGAGSAMYVIKPELFRVSPGSESVANTNDNSGSPAQAPPSNVAVGPNGTASNDAGSNAGTAANGAAQGSDQAATSQNPQTQETSPQKDQPAKSDTLLFSDNRPKQEVVTANEKEGQAQPPKTASPKELTPATPAKPAEPEVPKSATITRVGPDGRVITRTITREEFEKLPPAQKRRIREMILRQNRPLPAPTPPQ